MAKVEIPYLRRLEALLTLEKEGLSLSKLSRLMGVTKKDIPMYLEALDKRYRERHSVLCIERRGPMYQLTLDKDFQDTALVQYATTKKPLSQGLLEVLAIIAYKQPVTKAEIDKIRGVNNAAYLKKLMDTAFIEVVGKKKVVGRPSLYGTTLQFLRHFEMNSLKELPPLEEVKAYDFLESN